jgi:hypothetical protein
MMGLGILKLDERKEKEEKEREREQGVKGKQ